MTDQVIDYFIKHAHKVLKQRRNQQWMRMDVFSVQTVKPEDELVKENLDSVLDMNNAR